jgi:ribonuclease G
MDVNIAAALEIARQLKLRDMGGIIVVDFIDMHDQEHKQVVFEKMKEAMSTDRAKHNILPLSKFGLMQITRQRVRPELSVETTEKCPTCRGTGEISPNIVFEEDLFNNISFIVNNQFLKSLTVKLHPYIASYLQKGIVSKQWQWSRKLKCRLKIVAVPSFNYLEHHFFNKDEEEIL